MKTLGEIPLGMLHLDPKNPRLPEAVQDQPQEALLKHLYETAALDELAESMSQNGFFSSEPIIVDAGKEGEPRIVLEGNRRVATALILSGDPRASSAGLSFDFLKTPGKEVVTLPTLEVDDPDEFSAYLGFRHISGLRTWGAGEKARYLWQQVNMSKAEDPFYAVGKTVGSNSRGVRNAYIAWGLLTRAREGGAVRSTDHVRSDRFGVWTRALGTANVLAYIGYDAEAKTQPEVDAAIDSVREGELLQVLEDLTPAEHQRQALISDSRRVTAYSSILGNAEATEVLHSTGNIDVALAMVQRPEVEVQMQDVLERLKLIISLVGDSDSVSEEAVELADQVRKATRSLLAGVAALENDLGI